MASGASIIIDYPNVYTKTVNGVTSHYGHMLIDINGPKGPNIGGRDMFYAKFLYANETKYKYKYFELPPEKFENEIISSTTIRNLLLNGEISKANSMLGYKFKISGKIVKGNQLGRTIGFPTANLEYPTDLIELPHGVYSVKTNYGEGNLDIFLKSNSYK